MTENLNIVETVLRIKGEARRYKKIELKQAFNAHHSIEATLPFDELGKGWLNDPSNIINLIGEKISVTMHNTVTGEENYFEGVVTNAIVKGDKGDDTVVVIKGASPTILLDGKKAMDSFADTTLEFAVKESVKDSGNGAEVIAEPQCQDSISYLAQYDETCFEFLNRLSYEYGEWFYYDGSDIKFGRGRRAAEETMLVYSENLSEFNIDATLTPARFARYNYFPYNDKGQILTASESVHHSNSYLQSAINKSDKAYTSENRLPLKASIDTYQSMETIINSERGRAAGNMFKIHGTSNTCAVMLAHIVNIVMPKNLGMENRQLGIFTVTEVTHTISENGRYYSNDFTGVVASLNDIPMEEPKLPVAQPQRAKVISNADSKGRVKVAFQWQEDIGKTTNWIPVATPSAGKSDAVSQNRGMVFIPEEGDVVNIGFYYNDPSRPYVSGSVFTEFTGKGGGANNNTKSIITRSGIKIVCNDGDGSVYIEDPSGNIVKCDGNKAVTITAPKNITLNAGENMNINVGNDLMLNVGNNQTANIGNAAFMNVMRQIMVSTPFMQQLISDYFHTQAGKALINSQNEVKIESPETSVVGEQKLFMHSAEKAVVNSQGTMEIRGEQGTEDLNTADDYETAKETIGTKVVVQFRTSGSYNGEYGFDWLRGGDSGRRGDTWYADIMGTYRYTVFIKDIHVYNRFVRNEFAGKQFVIPWKPRTNNLYIVPVMTLLKGREAVLTLKMEVEEKAKEIKYKYESKYLTLSKTDVPIMDKGKYTLADEIKITCIEEFAKDQTIEVIAKDDEGNETLAGKLLVKANNAAHRKNVNVVLVIVNSNISGIRLLRGHKPNASMARINRLKKYFDQCYINANIVYKELDMATDATRYREFNRFASDGHINRSIDGSISDSLYTLLVDAFDYDYSSMENYYKIFLINEPVGVYNDLSGKARDVGAREAIIFNPGLNDSTVAHELFHAMGLYHSFSSKNIYIWEKYKTDNIMDYSDIDGINIPVIATWQYQWKKLNPNI